MGQHVENFEAHQICIIASQIFSGKLQMTRARHFPQIRASFTNDARVYMRDLAGAKFRLGVGVNHFAIASV